MLAVVWLFSMVHFQMSRDRGGCYLVHAGGSRTPGTLSLCGWNTPEWRQSDNEMLIKRSWDANIKVNLDCLSLGCLHPWQIGIPTDGLLNWLPEKQLYLSEQCIGRLTVCRSKGWRFIPILCSVQCVYYSVHTCWLCRLCESKESTVQQQSPEWWLFDWSVDQLIGLITDDWWLIDDDWHVDWWLIVRS